MRKLAIATLLLAAACSDGGAGEADKQKAAASKNVQLTPGQWETVVEVTKLTQQDKAAKPAIDTPAGTKSIASACVTQADVKNPPPVLLAGSDAYKCTSSNMYMSGGTLSTSLTCTRKGLNGEVRMSVDGSYTADTIQANQSLSTFLPGEGDVGITSNLTARRTGECAAAPVKAG
ncbi:MAG TPA: DUF3617 family protein [Allosphingosinicella sp.]|jgi:hypothetical protein|uniref:DUF3617 domain-containing protein n=1 Tax=Allosphingosinicella sp. TaxID=2823234 RepID=UPI002F2A1F90